MGGIDGCVIANGRVKDRQVCSCVPMDIFIHPTKPQLVHFSKKKGGGGGFDIGLG